MALLFDGFGRILIDIIVLGRKRKMCIVLEEKIKYVPVARTSSLVR